jgi:integrase
MRQRLSDRIARELLAPAKGNRITYDADVPGFGLRVTAKGARSWVLNYTSKGRERRYTIGSFPSWKERQARARAEELRRIVDMGGDPMGDRHAERVSPTIGDLVARFEQEALPKLRPATRKEYAGILALHVLPSLGKKRVADVRHADVEQLHRKIAAKSPIRANRTMSVLSRMFGLAMKWEMRADNPARGIERSPELKRTRYLTGAEIERLSAALAASAERAPANVVRMLLFTGARRNEVLWAEWAQFDLERGVWTKPAATTKQRAEHRVPLSAPAIELLREMRAENRHERFLFPGMKAGTPITSIRRFWASICRQAAIEGAHVHDLRHTYASILASEGLSLPIIGALLGHSQPSTTHRYAHLLDDPLRAATEKAAEAITGKRKR